MRPNVLKLIEQCVEDGIILGWNKAHKHTDDPSPKIVQEQISYSVMSEIHEWFKFEEVEEIDIQ